MWRDKQNYFEGTDTICLFMLCLPLLTISLIYPPPIIDNPHTQRRFSTSQTYVILQYKLLAAILIAVCSVIQQS